MRILLVDDDPALRTLLKTTFEVADVAVVEAEDAAAARRKIRSARPDVVVLDINMPGTTGLELCAELREWGKQLLESVDWGFAPEAIRRLAAPSIP